MCTNPGKDGADAKGVLCSGSSYLRAGDPGLQAGEESAPPVVGMFTKYRVKFPVWASAPYP